ncbi:MAG: hypothetical protein ACRD4K_13850 [Candidatus Acidiferrales bacterium]
MAHTRRNFMAALIPAAAIGFAPFLALADQQNPFPGGPIGRQQKPGFPPEPEPKIDMKVIMKANQTQMHNDVNRLFDLAQDLKNEVSKTDSTSILSLPLVHKAEEIEKLAKQIKNLAKS